MADLRNTQLGVDSERAILVGVFPKIMSRLQYQRDPLDELKSLVSTAGARVVDELTQYRDRPEQATLLGKGRLQDLVDLAKAQDAGVIIFNNDLTPSQIRNIEAAVERKIIDRSQLILDIFANRAQTYEAKLQVELAQLEYTYPRLRAMWSHLERIAGGAPAGIGTRGPGEQQLEIDRRMVQRRKADLRHEIKVVQERKRREVAKRNNEFFTVGVVGYTNAGKSTLFNTLTGAEVYADDKLFATLDTRTRRWSLGGGDEVMLSDTVGFVRDLPHHLVASFRATLEEAIYSDMLLIVLDVSDEDALVQYETVQEVLKGIGADEQPSILVLNKMDLIKDPSETVGWQTRHENCVSISAKQGVGIHELVEQVRVAQTGGEKQLSIRVALNEGKTIGFLENRATIHERTYGTDDVVFDLTIAQRSLDQLQSHGGHFEIIE